MQLKHLFSFAGVSALTSRNFEESDFVEVINLIDKGIDIAVAAKKEIHSGFKWF